MPIFRRDSESDDTPETPSAFRERSTRAPSTAGPPSRTRHTVIAPGTEMIGEITGVTDVTVEGDLQGEVRIDGTVRVGPGGRVRGALEARVVEVGGKVKGDVRGRERIVLDASAELLGDLAAPRVVIHEGAFFKGEVEMTGGGARGRKAAGTVTEKTPPKTPTRSTRGTGPSKPDTSAGTETTTETSTKTGKAAGGGESPGLFARSGGEKGAGGGSKSEGSDGGGGEDGNNGKGKKDGSDPSPKGGER